jgi:hypothetical protein
MIHLHEFGLPQKLSYYLPNSHRTYRERESSESRLPESALAIAPFARPPMANTMAPNQGAKESYNVLPEWRGRVYISDY